MQSNRRVRVGFVSIEDASNVASWSGIPFNILKHLRQLPVDVEVFSPLSRTLKYLLIPPILFAKIRKKRLFLNHYPLLLKSYARQIERQLARRPVDVIVAVTSLPISYLRCSAPVVCWNDAFFHEIVDYYPGFFSSLTAAAVRRGKREEVKALQRADVAIFSSRWAADGARALKNPQKLEVIYFGSNLASQLSEQEVAARARQKRAERKTTCDLLFVGVEWDRKGGDIAVQTAGLLNAMGVKTTLRAVGSRPATAPPEYVELLGFISTGTESGRQRLNKLFEEADFFILPTKAEAAGIVFCEASSFGLPILTYDTGGVGEYVRDGVNGAALPLGAGPETFAAKIRSMLDPERYEQLSVSAWQEYRERLTWSVAVHRLLEICEALIAERQISD